MYRNIDETGMVGRRENRHYNAVNFIIRPEMPANR